MLLRGPVPLEGPGAPEGEAATATATTLLGTPWGPRLQAEVAPLSGSDRIALQRLLPDHPEPTDGRPDKYWQGWLSVQLRQEPRLRAAVADYARAVREAPPATVNQIFALALGAVEKLAAPSLAHPHRERFTIAAALSVVAAHTFRNKELGAEERIIQLFPRYLKDGRLNDIGYDKACHYWSHAFVSFMVRYDREYGESRLQHNLQKLEQLEGLSSVVDAIERAYHASRGTPGSLLTSARRMEERVASPYAASARYPNEADAAAYRASVRGGYLYKHYRTIDAFGPYDPTLIGLAAGDQRSAIDTTRLQSGLWDAGVGRDLFANDAGTRAGLTLWQAGQPGAVPHEDLITPTESDPGTAARASALTKALQKKEVLPHQLIAFAIAAAPELGAGSLGRRVSSSMSAGPHGWVLRARHEAGEASLTLDRRDHRPDEPMLVHLRVKIAGGPGRKVSLPATDLPTRAALKG